MLRKICNYRQVIKKTMQKVGIYKREHDLKITDLATALYIRDLSNSVVDNLHTTTITTLVDGRKRVRVHPAVKTQQEAEAEIYMLYNALGLTAEVLSKANTPQR